MGKLVSGILGMDSGAKSGQQAAQAGERCAKGRHLICHNPIKKHVCVLCFKTFSLAQYLKEHTFIHSD